MMLFFVFVLACLLGFELINRVPSQLHTPLMSGANAASGVTLVGAVGAAIALAGTGLPQILALVAVIFATVNVVGGYLVTDRMFSMFGKSAQKDKGQAKGQKS